MSRTGSSPRSPLGSDGRMADVEKRIMEHIVTERNERFRAVNELWDKMCDLQGHIRQTPRLRQQNDQLKLQLESVVREQEQAAVNAKLDSSRGGEPEVTDTEDQDEALHRKARTSFSWDREVSQSESLKRLADLETEVAGLKADQQAHSADKADQLSQRAAPAGLQGRAPSEVVLSKIDGLRSSMEELAKRFKESDLKNTRELEELHGMVVRTDHAMRLECMKTMRLALNNGHLSSEERARATETLDQTEQAVRRRLKEGTRELIANKPEEGAFGSDRKPV